MSDPAPTDAAEAAEKYANEKFPEPLDASSFQRSWNKSTRAESRNAFLAGAAWQRDQVVSNLSALSARPGAAEAPTLAETATTCDPSGKVNEWVRKADYDELKAAYDALRCPPAEMTVTLTAPRTGETPPETGWVLNPPVPTLAERIRGLKVTGLQHWNDAIDAAASLAEAAEGEDCQ